MIVHEPISRFLLDKPIFSSILLALPQPADTVLRYSLLIMVGSLLLLHLKKFLPQRGFKKCCLWSWDPAEPEVSAASDSNLGSRSRTLAWHPSVTSGC